jgi:uncharacterized protein DUF2752
MDGVRWLLVAAFVLARLLPRPVLDADARVCLFRLATGRPCPACGLTRSWMAAARLDVGESVAWHPLGIPALLGTIAAASGVANPTLDDERTRRWAAAAVVAWLAVWAVRFLRPPARLRA